MRVGFLGLGAMGTPMALNLSRKFRTCVWNRSPSRYSPFSEAGVAIAGSPSQVIDQSDIIFTMLFDGPTTHSIIDDDFRRAIRGKTLINTGTVSIDSSLSLSQKIIDAGGSFIEMPVSGSKVPAEEGNLVGLMAGDSDVAEQVKPFVEPITRAAIYCGPIGSGLKAKYAANLFLVVVNAGLAESMNLARAQGLNLEAFGKVLEAGQLASAYSRVKIPKIINQDWSVQGSVKACYNGTQLIQSTAQTLNVHSPVLHASASLLREAEDSGMGDDDMIAIYKKLADAGNGVC